MSSRHTYEAAADCRDMPATTPATAETKSAGPRQPSLLQLLRPLRARQLAMLALGATCLAAHACSALSSW